MIPLSVGMVAVATVGTGGSRNPVGVLLDAFRRDDMTAWTRTCQ